MKRRIIVLILAIVLTVVAFSCQEGRAGGDGASLAPAPAKLCLVGLGAAGEAPSALKNQPLG